MVVVLMMCYVNRDIDTSRKWLKNKMASDSILLFRDKCRGNPVIGVANTFYSLVRVG